ncbi:MAG: helix-turn-helix domain-containing protein [Thiothrix sp.]|nr:MAG: helix-turn-helix domain-containing protein [Thiothrix sp.]
MSNRLLSLADIQKEKINLSRVYIWQLRKEGRFPQGILIGRKNYWSEAVIDDWINSKKVKAA